MTAVVDSRDGNALDIGAVAVPIPADVLAALRAAQSGVFAPRNKGTSRGLLVRRTLVIADGTALVLAFISTALIFGPGAGSGNRFALGAEYLMFLATLPVWVFAAKLYELYDRDEERTEHSTLDDFVGVLHLVTVGVWLLYLGVRVTDLASPELAKVGTFWLLSLLFVTVGRAAGRAFCRRQPSYLQNTVIVGAGTVGQLVARKLLQHDEYGIRLVGFVDDEPRPLRAELDSQRVLGGLDDLMGIVRAHRVDRVVLAFSRATTETMIALTRTLKRLDVQIDIVPRFFDTVGPNVIVHSVEGLPLLGLPSSKLLPFSRTIKRTIDIIGASTLLLFTAPLFAFISWRVRRDSPGPILFRQARVGEGMREFEVLKFRTMYVETDDSAHREFIKKTMTAGAAPTENGLYKLERTDAITKCGRWLRRTSLDELPNLVNVLRGEMSLVGPRPCIAYELETFETAHYERFLMPAGITGMWQVTARAHSTFGEALDMDVVYVRNWSLGLDLWLLLRTPFELLGKATR